MSSFTDAEREWRLLAADGDECWVARRGAAAAGDYHPEDRLYEVALHGTQTWNAFAVSLPAVPVHRTSLVELRDQVGDWLALPMARWRTDPFETTARLSDGSTGTLEMTWGPCEGWIVPAGATVATCRFTAASMAVRHQMVVNPTCLGLFHVELTASLQQR